MLTRLIKEIKLATILPIALVAFVPIAAQKAEANPARCGKHTSIVDLLEKKYGETPRNIGMVSDKGVMQVFVSPEKGTWTILMTNAHGQSCLLAAGKNWEELKQKALDENA